MSTSWSTPDALVGALLKKDTDRSSAEKLFTPFSNRFQDTREKAVRWAEKESMGQSVDRRIVLKDESLGREIKDGRARAVDT